MERQTKGSAKVQIGAELLCKSAATESQGTSWHVGTWTRGDYKLEAWLTRGSEAQREKQTSWPVDKLARGQGRQEEQHN